MKGHSEDSSEGMVLDLTIDEILTTTRAVRKRLDLTKQVSRQTVEECAALAFQAPNGSNQQRWGWVCVDARRFGVRWPDSTDKE